MDGEAMTPFEAVFQRRSVRHFEKEPVPEYILEKIENFEGDLIPIFPFVKVETRIFRAEEYGHSRRLFQVKAPYYLAIYAQQLDGYKMNAGNIMEQIALYLHSQGIGTCFVGMMKPPKEDVPPEDMSFVLMLAFGMPKGELHRDAEDAPRESMEKICVYKQEPLKATQQLLDAARLAPSSINSQPWKFVVYRNRIHIFVTDKKHLAFQKQWTDIDMGIMIAHILMAAEEYWVDLTMTRAENLAEKSVPNYRYVGSVLVKP